MEQKSPSQRSRKSISVDFLEMPVYEQSMWLFLTFTMIFLRGDEMTAAQTAFHLLYDATLKFGKPEEVIFSDKGPGFIREMAS
jgi:hypothetical protein